MRSWMIAVIVVAACGKDKAASGPAVVAGAPAGDVLEVNGGVSAKRGDEPMRALKAGDVVSGDDVIGTTDDGSVVIKLRHNGVRFLLRGGHDQKLSDSRAWKEPKHVDEAPAVTPPVVTPPTPTPTPTPTSLEVGFSVEGEVMPSELDAAVASHRDALLLCVSGTGARALTFTVAPDGKVGAVAVGEGALTVDAACLTEAFAALKLPAYASPTSVTVSLSVGG